MSEQSSVLDGIKDIVQPAMPLLTDWSIYFVMLAIVVTVALSVLLFIYYRRLPGVRAKRLYRQLKKNWPEMQAQQCGQIIMSILRLSQGIYNLNEKSYPDLSISLSKKQWQWLIWQSNQLRFSVDKTKPANAMEIFPLIDQVLWPTQ